MSQNLITIKGGYNGLARAGGNSNGSTPAKLCVYADITLTSGPQIGLLGLVPGVEFQLDSRYVLNNGGSEWSIPPPLLVNSACRLLVVDSGSAIYSKAPAHRPPFQCTFMSM